jgi:hypothetical protein
MANACKEAQHRRRTRLTLKSIDLLLHVSVILSFFPVNSNFSETISLSLTRLVR